MNLHEKLKLGRLTPYEVYRHLAGEIESRDVEARLGMTEEQRAAMSPYSSENIAPEDAIVLQGQGGAATSAAGDAFRAKLAEARASAKTIEYNARIPIGFSSEALRLAGLPKGRIFIKPGVALGKPNQSDHPYPPSFLDNLPELLDESMLVHESWKVPGSFVAVFDVRYQGKSFAAALHFTETKNGIEVTEVKSFYPRNDKQVMTAFQKTGANKEGKIRYWDKKKTQTYLSQSSRFNSGHHWLDMLESRNNIRSSGDLFNSQKARFQGSVSDTVTLTVPLSDGRPHTFQMSAQEAYGRIAKEEAILEKLKECIGLTS